MKIRNHKDLGFSELLRLKIRSFNNCNSKYHLASRAKGYVKNIQIEEEDNGKFVAGLAARIYWDCMFIDDLFVEEEYRGKGLGSEILKKAIVIAKENNCKFVVLNTFGFQARGFYEKFGFAVVGEIRDYPPGDSYFTLRLDL